MSHAYLVGRLAVFYGINFSVGHYTQTFQLIFSIQAMLMGTINIYHYTTFTDMAGDLKVSTSKTSWVHLLAHFSADQDEI